MGSRAILMCEMLPFRIPCSPYLGTSSFVQVGLWLPFDGRLRSNFHPPLRCPLSNIIEIFVVRHLLVCISLLHISARCDSTFFLCPKLCDPRPSLATISDSSDTTRCIRCAEDQFPRVPEIQRNVVFPPVVPSKHIP